MLSSACVIDSKDGRVECWGAGSAFYNQAFQERSGFQNIAVGQYHVCASIDDEIQCAVGVEGFGIESVDELQFDGKVIDLVSGNIHACALTEHGTIACWGDNSREQVDVPIESFYTAIFAGPYVTCGLDQSSELICGGKLHRSSWWEAPMCWTTADEFDSGCKNDDDGVSCWGAYGSGAPAQQPPTSY